MKARHVRGKDLGQQTLGLLKIRVKILNTKTIVAVAEKGNC